MLYYAWLVYSGTLQQLSTANHEYTTTSHFDGVKATASINLSNLIRSTPSYQETMLRGTGILFVSIICILLVMIFHLAFYMNCPSKRNQSHGPTSPMQALAHANGLVSVEVAELHEVIPSSNATNGCTDSNIHYM